MNTKAAFFDRDNTLVIDTNYMHKVSDLKFVDGVFDTLREIQKRGYQLFIVTNQSGIGRGFFTEAQMHEFNQAMLSELANHQINIKEIVFCPHTPEAACDCRKPSPKLVNELIKKYQIDPTKSFMIGDKESDVLCGENAGLTSLLIGAGYKNSIKTFSEILNYLK